MPESTELAVAIDQKDDPFIILSLKFQNKNLGIVFHSILLYQTCIISFPPLIYGQAAFTVIRPIVAFQRVLYLIREDQTWLYNDWFPDLLAPA